MADNEDQTTPIEPLQLQEQEPPVEAVIVEASAERSSGRGGRIAMTAVAAAALVALSGVTGYALGHQSNDGSHRDVAAVAAGASGGEQGGRQDGQQGGRGWDQDSDGQGMMGDQNGQGLGRGVDPDGDNWTGGDRHMDGGQGMMGDQNGQGLGRGVDPDGDNWTGGGQGMMGGQSGTLPTTPQEFKQFLQENNITSLQQLVQQYGPQALMLLQQMQSQSTQS